MELNLDLLARHLDEGAGVQDGDACALADGAAEVGSAAVTEDGALRSLVALGLLARCSVGAAAKTVFRVTMPGVRAPRGLVLGGLAPRRGSLHHGPPACRWGSLLASSAMAGTPY